MGKHIVVTGATGNVGIRVVAALAARPEVDSIVGVARRAPDWHLAKVSWTEADVRTADLEAVVRGADAVVHLAWAFQPSHQPAVTWDVNAVGTSRLLDAVARSGVPAVVVASSVGAYTPWPTFDGKEPVDESWPTDGYSPAAYTREKAYVERMLDAFELQQPDCRVVRLRPAFLFQAPASPEQLRIFGGPLVPARLAGRVRLPFVPALPGLVFQAMHTEDVAEAYVAAVLSDVPGPFNLAADPVIDATVIADVFGGRPLPTPAGPVRAALAAAWRARLIPAPPDLFDYFLRVPLMDTTRARTELGWKPLRSAREALADLREGLADPQGFPTPPLHG
jgi:UDP-glucose 4-epimerase